MDTVAEPPMDTVAEPPMDTVAELGRLLAPRSIAVIGSSRACGRVVEQNRALGFRGPIWPVHPTRATIAGEAAGPCDVVVGVGLNVDMSPQAAHDIDQPWIDIGTIRHGVGRNRLAGRLLHHLLLALARFQLDGLTPFLAEWRDKDILAGRALRLSLPDEELRGIGCGIDSDGALLVDLQGKRQRFTYGEVSLRAEEGMP